MKVNFGFLVSKFLRLINRPALRNCEIHKTSKVGTGSNCVDVTMERYSYMGKNNSVHNTRIGSFCSIASYCSIGGGGHSLDLISTSPLFAEGRNIFRKNFSVFPTNTINLPVIIGNDVWIGEGVFIKDGVTIADGAVVGAHSVVTKDVPAYSIVAGSPARTIRYRFKESEIRKLLQIKWWELSETQLKRKARNFDSIEKFLEKEKEKYI